MYYTAGLNEPKMFFFIKITRDMTTVTSQIIKGENVLHQKLTKI